MSSEAGLRALSFSNVLYDAHQTCTNPAVQAVLVTIEMAIIDIDPQKITPSFIGMALGGVLLLLAATGGDIRIKEIHLPTVSGPWRVVSGLAAVLLLLFGFGILPKPGSSPVAASKQDVADATAPIPVNRPPSSPSSNGQPATDIRPAQMTTDQRPLPAPARHNSSSSPACEANFSLLETHARNPDKPYMWHSYNSDLEALRNAADNLIGYLQTDVHSSNTKIDSCFSKLDADAKLIHENACSELARTGDDGKPVDSSYDLHCGKNFVQFHIRVDGLKHRLIEKDYKVTGLELGNDIVGFDTWLDESVVKGSDGKRF